MSDYPVLVSETSTANLIADAREAVRLDRMKCETAAMVLDVIDRLTEQDELLASIWLYVNWRYLSKQMTTKQKELWADAIDANGEPGPKADRWWRE